MLIEGLALLAESPTRQSLILMRRGYVVYEQYFNGSHVADSNNIASVSKSILSALFGIALDQGFFITAEDRIADYLPMYFSEVSDPRVLDLTIREMLTMTHGLAWVENETERFLTGSQDWVADILSLPVNHRTRHPLSLQHRCLACDVRRPDRSHRHEHLRIRPPLSLRAARHRSRVLGCRSRRLFHRWPQRQHDSAGAGALRSTLS